MLLYAASPFCPLVFGPHVAHAVTWRVPSLTSGTYRLVVEGWTDRAGGTVRLDLAHTLVPLWAAWSFVLPATLVRTPVALLVRVRLPVAAPLVRLTRCADSLLDTAVGTFLLARVTLTACSPGAAR